jgi:rhodanese-related sulfurtransferase
MYLLKIQYYQWVNLIQNSSDSFRVKIEVLLKCIFYSSKVIILIQSQNGGVYNMTTIIDVNPTDTWTGLAEKPDSILVDVRTNAEWSFVGIPDLSSVDKQAILIEWSQFPTMTKNKDFASNLMDKLNGSAPSDVYFLCRSGVRSLAAAALMIETFAAQGWSVNCINVTEGFEGDLDAEGHRGNLNGWRARGLAWRQS